MKAISIGLALTLSCAIVCQAGVPAPGMTCHYDPHPAAPDPGLAYGQYNCATSQYGELSTDWSMGGEPNLQAGDVKVLATAAPPYIIPGCQRGREMQVLVSGSMFVTNNWIFPRFLDCP